MIGSLGATGLVVLDLRNTVGMTKRVTWPKKAIEIRREMSKLNCLKPRFGMGVSCSRRAAKKQTEKQQLPADIAQRNHKFREVRGQCADSFCLFIKKIFSFRPVILETSLTMILSMFRILKTTTRKNTTY